MGGAIGKRSFDATNPTSFSGRQRQRVGAGETGSSHASPSTSKRGSTSSLEESRERSITPENAPPGSSDTLRKRRGSLFDRWNTFIGVSSRKLEEVDDSTTQQPKTMTVTVPNGFKPGQWVFERCPVSGKIFKYRMPKDAQAGQERTVTAVWSQKKPNTVERDSHGDDDGDDSDDANQGRKVKFGYRALDSEQIVSDLLMRYAGGDNESTDTENDNHERVVEITDPRLQARIRELQGVIRPFTPQDASKDKKSVTMKLGDKCGKGRSGDLVDAITIPPPRFVQQHHHKTWAARRRSLQVGMETATPDDGAGVFQRGSHDDDAWSKPRIVARTDWRELVGAGSNIVLRKSVIKAKEERQLVRVANPAVLPANLSEGPYCSLCRRAPHKCVCVEEARRALAKGKDADEANSPKSFSGNTCPNSYVRNTSPYVFR